MEFCPKCGSLMMPKKVNGKTVMACKCGHKKESENTAIKEEVKNTKNRQTA